MEAQRDGSGTKSEEEIQNAIELYADMIQETRVLHMKQRADAEDILQTIFLRYVQSESFRGHGHEEVWSLKVVMNVCRERFRGWFHKRTDLQIEVEARTDLSEASYFLLDTLNQLPPHYCDALYLLYCEGYKVREISEVRRENEDTVRTWLKRGKEAPRERLGGELNDFR